MWSWSFTNCGSCSHRHRVLYRHAAWGLHSTRTVLPPYDFPNESKDAMKCLPAVPWRPAPHGPAAWGVGGRACPPRPCWGSVKSPEQLRASAAPGGSPSRGPTLPCPLPTSGFRPVSQASFCPPESLPGPPARVRGFRWVRPLRPESALASCLLFLGCTTPSIWGLQGQGPSSWAGAGESLASSPSAPRGVQGGMGFRTASRGSPEGR